MGARLMPSNLAELCAYALQFERRTAARYDEYQGLLRAWGATRAADALGEIGRAQQQEVRALEAGARGEGRSDASLWEYAWQFAFSPEALDATRPFVPRNVGQALGVVAAAERRAEAYYADVAEHARDAIVRECAAEMAEHKRKRGELMECLRARESRTDWTRRVAAETLDAH